MPFIQKMTHNKQQMSLWKLNIHL